MSSHEMTTQLPGIRCKVALRRATPGMTYEQDITTVCCEDSHSAIVTVTPSDGGRKTVMTMISLTAAKDLVVDRTKHSLEIRYRNGLGANDIVSISGDALDTLLARLAAIIGMEETRRG